MTIERLCGDAAAIIHVGDSINTVAGRILAKRAIDFDPDHPERYLTLEPGAPRLDYQLCRVDTLQEARTTLGLSASVSAGIEIFAADVAYRELSDVYFRETSTYILVQCKVLNPARCFKHPIVTDSALAVYQNNQDDFLAQYGTDYAHGIIDGGEITVLLELKSATVDRKKEVLLSVDASVGAFVSGQLTFGQAMQQVSSMTSIQLHTLRRGTHEAVPTVDRLIRAAEDLPALVAPGTPGAATMEILLRSYATVENLPGAFPTFQIIQRENDMGSVASFLDEARQRASALRYASLHPDEFGGYTREEFSARWAATQRCIADLIKSAESIAYGRPYVVLPPNLPPAFPPPETTVSYEWRILDPCGRTVLGIVRPGMDCTVTFKGRWAGGNPPSQTNPYCGARGLLLEQTWPPEWSAIPNVTRIRPRADVGMFCAVVELWEFGNNQPTRRILAKDDANATGQVQFHADKNYEVRIAMNDKPGVFGDNVNDPTDPMCGRLYGTRKTS